MTYKEHLIEKLQRATALINDVLSDELTLQDFVNQYNNFYYAEALDGHEADEQQRQVLSELHHVVEFHERIQNEVVNPACFESSEELHQYIAAGRISVSEAMKRLRKLCGDYDILTIINDLAERYKM